MGCDSGGGDGLAEDVHVLVGAHTFLLFPTLVVQRLGPVEVHHYGG